MSTLEKLRSWPTWAVALLVGAGTALVATLCFSPRFWLWPAAGLPLPEFVSLQPEFHRAYWALQQLADPWRRIDDPVNRVLEWRLLWPVLSHAAGLPPALHLALPHVGALAALATTAGFAWRETRDALPTLALTALAATASWFFVSCGWLGYFDSWLLLALLLAAFARHRSVLLGAALFAPWIDERFLLALPVVVAVRACGTAPDAPPARRDLLRDAAALLAGLAPYAAVRLGFEFAGTRATSGSYWHGRPLLPAPWPVLAWGAWNGLRLGWVLLAAAVVPRRAGGRRGWLAGTLAATLVLNLLVADDLSRSASVLVPAVVSAGLILWRRDPVRARRLLPLLAAGNLLLPAWHVIAAPGTAAAWHAVPVLSVAAEWDRHRHPPDFASPETYHRRSLDHLQNDQRARALAANAIALRFDPGHARSIAHRGILLHLEGRHDAGRAELDRALALAPGLYDARLQRASFRQQAGDLAGALADVREALRAMPADWPRRREAEQYERALARQAGRN